VKAKHTLVTEDSFRHEVLESHQLVLVEFKAEWSGASHIMAPVIERVSNRCAGRCRVCLVENGTGNPLFREYGITALPTILLFKSGSVVARISGPVSERVLEETIEAALGEASHHGGPPGSSPDEPANGTHVSLG